MRTMSWSRYHALSWSFMRIRGRLRAGGAKRTRRAAKGAAVGLPAAMDAWADRPGSDDRRFERRGFRSGRTGGFAARTLRAVTTIFRTGAVPRDTDI
jgi:hypothetical protein